MYLYDEKHIAYLRLESLKYNMLRTALRLTFVLYSDEVL